MNRKEFVKLDHAFRQDKQRQGTSNNTNKNFKSHIETILPGSVELLDE